MIIVSVKSNQLVKNIKNLKKINQLKLGFNPFLPPKSWRFLLLGGYNIQPRSSSTNQNAALVIDHQLDFTKVQYTFNKLYKGESQFCNHGTSSKISLGFTPRNYTKNNTYMCVCSTMDSYLHFATSLLELQLCIVYIPLVCCQVNNCVQMLAFKTNIFLPSCRQRLWKLFEVMMK